MVADVRQDLAELFVSGRSDLDLLAFFVLARLRLALYM